LRSGGAGSNLNGRSKDKSKFRTDPEVHPKSKLITNNRLGNIKA
jgi:hypothetical protein